MVTVTQKLNAPYIHDKDDWHEKHHVVWQQHRVYT